MAEEAGALSRRASKKMPAISATQKVVGAYLAVVDAKPLLEKIYEGEEAPVAAMKLSGATKLWRILDTSTQRAGRG
jgi:hypothetical protein